MTDQEINEAVARKLGWFQKGNWWYRSTDLFTGFGAPPDYCGGIGAAWEIVEHLAQTTYINRPGVGGKEWHVSFGDPGWSEADTAPMAICLAFLKLP